jgi:hypothetical protein
MMRRAAFAGCFPSQQLLCRTGAATRGAFTIQGGRSLMGTASFLGVSAPSSLLGRSVFASPMMSLATSPSLATPARHFSSKAKELDKSKLSTGKKNARGTPRFESLRHLLISIVVLLCAAVGIYGLRILYYYLRPQGNDRAIVARLQEELWMRPHWCAALVYAVAHHALCDPRTPFGSPLIAPAHFEPELREVLRLLRELQLDHPGTSLPDLWAAACTYAMANLGGPLIGLQWGRMEEEFPPDPIVVTAPKVSSYTGDVRTIKRTLGGRCELAADEMVAILGHRTLGVHGGAHGAQQRALMRESSAAIVESGKFQVKESSPSDEAPGMGSSTPGVFDNDYFISLEKDGWHPVARMSGGLFGGSGLPKPNKAGEAPPEPADDCVSAKTLALHTSPNAPCVAMQPLDLALKADLMLLPWVQKFAENEVRFFNAYTRAATKLLRCGWEGWNLRS